MLEKVKRRIQRYVRKKKAQEDRREADRGEADRGRVDRGEADAGIPEPPQPERPDEANVEAPPPGGDYAVPVTNKEKRHDGWSEIRPRRPGEDTDMGRDMIPDITDPGRDLSEDRS